MSIVSDPLALLPLGAVTTMSKTSLSPSPLTLSRRSYSQPMLPGWIEVSALKKPSERGEVELSEEDHAQHPVGRVGVASDIAHGVALLVDGTASGFMTGQELVLDGGMTKKMIYAE